MQNIHLTKTIPDKIFQALNDKIKLELSHVIEQTSVFDQVVDTLGSIDAPEFPKLCILDPENIMCICGCNVFLTMTKEHVSLECLICGRFFYVDGLII